jgi:hypothetical protein
MNSRKINILFLLIFMLFGCSPAATTPSIQSNRMEPSATDAPLPSPKAVIDVPSTTQEPDFPEGCINLKETPLDTSVLNGLLVVEDWNNYNDYFLDLKSNQILDIEEKKQLSWKALTTNVKTTKVSPNNKFIQAYITGKSYDILSTVDEIIKTYDTQGQEDWNRGRWLDNERMFFQYWQVPNGNTIVIYNPFSGEKKEMKLELPNPYIVIDGGGKAAWVKADIDPSLKRVLYNDKDERLVLWDLDTQQELASLPSPTDLTEGAWSPDGNEFSIPFPSSNSMPTEMLMIDTGGFVTKLTNFNQKFPFSRVDARPAWSPNGRLIAYWLQISNFIDADPKTLRQWLAITDTMTLDTKIYCLSPNKPPTHGGNIVWSPDGQHLIVNTDVLGGAIKPVLVDLNLLTQSKLDTHGLFVVDWMAP